MFTRSMQRVSSVGMQYTTKAISSSSTAMMVTSARSFVTSTPIVQTSQRSTSLRWIGAAAILGTAATIAFASTESSTVHAATDSGSLNAKDFTPLTLKKRARYNHNTDLFVFEIPQGATRFPCASFVLTKFVGPDGKDVIRPYTPLDEGENGELLLLVKDYPKGVMSSHIHKLKPGEKLDIKGPLPKYAYKPNSKKQIGMVAGGTGITPMLQIINEIIRNPEDKTEVSLLFANTSSQDILLRESLDAISRRHKNIKVTYLIDKPEDGWKGETGYVSKELLAKYMPKSSTDTQIFVCGPPGFYKVVSGTKTPKFEQGELTGALKELGYNEQNVFKL